MRAKDLMYKTTEVVHVDQTLMDASIRLQRRGLPALAVVDGDEIVGLITAETMKRKSAAPDNDLAAAKVRDHMSAEIAFCHAGEDIATARAVLQEGGHDYLLVTDSDGHLCGLISAAQIDTHDRNGSKGDREVAREHLVDSPGRATGDELHAPDTYSVDPKLKE